MCKSMRLVKSAFTARHLKSPLSLLKQVSSVDEARNYHCVVAVLLFFQSIMSRRSGVLDQNAW